MNFKDKFVKVIVRKKTNQLQFEKFLDKIIKTGAIDVKIVENFGIDDEEVDFSKDEGEDTLTILNKYIEDSDFELSKESVKNLMKEVLIMLLVLMVFSLFLSFGNLSMNYSIIQVKNQSLIGLIQMKNSQIIL